MSIAATINKTDIFKKAIDKNKIWDLVAIDDYALNLSIINNGALVE